MTLNAELLKRKSRVANRGQGQSEGGDTFLLLLSRLKEGRVTRSQSLAINLGTARSKVPQLTAHKDRGESHDYHDDTTLENVSCPTESPKLKEFFATFFWPSAIKPPKIRFIIVGHLMDTVEK